MTSAFHLEKFSATPTSSTGEAEESDSTPCSEFTQFSNPSSQYSGRNITASTIRLNENVRLGPSRNRNRFQNHVHASALCRSLRHDSPQRPWRPCQPREDKAPRSPVPPAAGSGTARAEDILLVDGVVLLLLRVPVLRADDRPANARPEGIRRGNLRRETHRGIGAAFRHRRSARAALRFFGEGVRLAPGPGGAVVEEPRRSPDAMYVWAHRPAGGRAELQLLRGGGARQARTAGRINAYSRRPRRRSRAFQRS